jgi:alpha/beta superfamily hydrolase
VITSCVLATDDGIALEGEWTAPDAALATVVLCHPHPQYGGTMRSIVISALFEALPQQGFACLRFNFRGVEGSGGDHTEGRDEPRDVRAALDYAAANGTGPIVLAGWSFGADMALSIEDARLAAWVGIAPPLRFRAASAYAAVGSDARPKLLELAANDEFRAPVDVEAETAAWVNRRVEVIAGASHFFVGRTDRVVDLTAGFVREVAG